MGYEAKIILDSICPLDIRLTTAHLRYPRRVHADMMTYRLFSRNGKSSRAKPVKKYIKEVLDDPAFPIWWGKNRSGMQAAPEEIRFKRVAQTIWHIGKWCAITKAWTYDKLGLHKQGCNRYLEPYIYMDLLITSTSEGWINFFAQRAGPDGGADPELQKVARMMARTYYQHKPQELNEDEWHLPYIKREDIEDVRSKLKIYNNRYVYTDLLNEYLCKISAARCARISYYSFNTDKLSSIDEDITLFNKLMHEDIAHASPCEHQARALPYTNNYIYDPKISGNLPGYAQYRKSISNELCKNFNFEGLSNEEFIIN